MHIVVILLGPRREDKADSLVEVRARIGPYLIRTRDMYETWMAAKQIWACRVLATCSANTVVMHARVWMMWTVGSEH